MQIEHIAISWSTSRGRDTYGYNICRADSRQSRTRYRTCGGGYDMIGTVMGDYFEAEHQQELRDLCAKQDMKPYVRDITHCSLYGMFQRADGSVYLDGACGIESIIRIIEACGYEVQREGNRKGHTIGFYVSK